MIAAMVVWPTIVPLSILLMERQKNRRKILYAILAVGIAISLGHGIGILIYQTGAQISGFHIMYTMDAPSSLSFFSLTGYLIATIPPMFVSSTKKVYLFGIIIMLSYAAAQFFFSAYLVSVWCFFAALISAVIWWIVKEQSIAENPCEQAAVS
jgi:disulfide bond formation protein DsbB